jgi:hypothetical protein
MKEGLCSSLPLGRPPHGEEEGTSGGAKEPRDSTSLCLLIPNLEYYSFEFRILFFIPLN